MIACTSPLSGGPGRRTMTGTALPVSLFAKTPAAAGWQDQDQEGHEKMVNRNEEASRG
jgi:hypothetical protein